jgi:mannitol-specific phosphotransferase system IIBC component
MRNNGDTKVTETGVWVFETALHILAIIFVGGVVISTTMGSLIGSLIFAGLGLFVIKQLRGFDKIKRAAREANTSLVEYLNNILYKKED